jgi:hypothetical protein
LAYAEIEEIEEFAAKAQRAPRNAEEEGVGKAEIGKAES